MFQPDDKQTTEYLRRSYSAVDGLWFMKVEEIYGFDVALDIDNEVWKVLPKIQARMLKSFANIESGLEALLACITVKLTLDGFKFKTERDDDKQGFRVIIEQCPWFDLLAKSGRGHLFGKIGDKICNTEYAAWAAEFGADISFELQEQICGSSHSCVLRFKSSAKTA
jgi:hypothetical protein